MSKLFVLTRGRERIQGLCFGPYLKDDLDVGGSF